MNKDGDSLSTTTVQLEAAQYALEHQRYLTVEDHLILKSLRPVVIGLARYWGTRCEVLLHSLEDLAHSIVQIENGEVTGRSVGSPITDLALKILKEGKSEQTDENHVNGGHGRDYRIYLAKSSEGKPLRSITMIIRNGECPIGMLCMNFDLTVPLNEILAILSPDDSPENDDDDSPEHFLMSAEDLVSRSIDTAISNALTVRGISPQQKNRSIVNELRQQGIFDVKGAVDMVAAELGVSRFTIYNYLRNIKQEGDQDEEYYQD